MMRKMGWEPGQVLGIKKRGIRYPIIVRNLSHNREGIGFNQDKLLERVGPESIVEVLKLKIEQEINEDILTQGIRSVFEEDEGEVKRVEFKSEIRILIFEYELNALVDTGSDITCISEEFWNELNQKYKNIIPIMPIKTLQIKTAVGHKSAEIKSIILLPMRIEELVLETGFMIVPNLVNHIILGFDWLKKNEVTIKFNKIERGLFIKLEGKDHWVKFCEQEEDSNKDKNVEIIKVNNINKIGEVLQGEIGTKLLVEEKDKLVGLLQKYKDLFSSKLGRANCYQHEIKMKTQEPIVKRTYPVPYAYREKIEEKLREMVDQRIISRSSTPYCSPLTFTLKKDGSIRVLLDAREINKYMISETEKPPIQIDVMNAFHGANYISVIDLNNAYFQIPISETSKMYTGFTFNGKSYIYNVLPQGLKTSVGSFSRAMDMILGHEVREFCVNYLDDLAIITTGSFDNHLEHLNIVLGKLKKAGMTCNLKKCEFFCQEVKMLGYIISTQGLRTDPDKVKSIQEFPAPKKLKQIRAFLGLCNFYRKFIPNYSKNTQPLCELLKKGVGWRWGSIEQEAFDRVKRSFIETILLHHPNFEEPYYLQTDSSGVGMAGVLYQVDKQGEMKILGFHSKALRGAQLNWTVTEQEFYSVISCLEKFETYLRGAQVVIRTDHKALIFVKTWKLYNARVTRWINYLENFQYKIEHIKGRENIVADILSRYPPESEIIQEDKKEMPSILYMETSENKELIGKLKDIVKLQREDKEISEIIKRVKNRKNSEEKIDKISDRSKIENDTLYFKPDKAKAEVIYLPEVIREELIERVHLEMGHQGVYKVIKYIRDRFYWSGLTKQVKQKIRKCHKCQISKSATVNFVGPCQSIVTGEIGELVMVDLYGPLPAGIFGMKYILVFQDSFSKFVKFYELREATSRSVLGRAKRFFEIIKPKAIMSDNGSQFTSKIWKENMEQNGVKIVYTTVRNPRPNIVERVNRELGRLFRTYCNTNHKGWVSVLPKLEVLYNNTYHNSTGFTPCEIMYGESTELTFDKYMQGKEGLLDIQQIREAARNNLIKNGENRRVGFNKRYRLKQYQIGDLVKIKKLNKSKAMQKITKKFESLYEGPYVVAENPYINVYILMDPKTKKVRGKFNSIHLSSYFM